MTKPVRNSHCGFCGGRFAEAQPWPRTCHGCGATSYRNPVPVAVVLLPVDGGLLLIRRGIEPRRGQLALPGGFIEIPESWQQAAARELREEAQIEIDWQELREQRVLSAPDGTVLIFGLAQTRGPEVLASFQPTSETSECVIVRAAEAAQLELAFPLHTQVMREYFAGQRGLLPPAA